MKPFQEATFWGLWSCEVALLGPDWSNDPFCRNTFAKLGKIDVRQIVRNNSLKNSLSFNKKKTWNPTREKRFRQIAKLTVRWMPAQFFFLARFCFTMLIYLTISQWGSYLSNINTQNEANSCNMHWNPFLTFLQIKSFEAIPLLSDTNQLKQTNKSINFPTAHTNNLTLIHENIAEAMPGNFPRSQDGGLT